MGKNEKKKPKSNQDKSGNMENRGGATNSTNPKGTQGANPNESR